MNLLGSLVLLSSGDLVLELLDLFNDTHLDGYSETAGAVCGDDPGMLAGWLVDVCGEILPAYNLTPTLQICVFAWRS